MYSHQFPRKDHFTCDFTCISKCCGNKCDIESICMKFVVLSDVRVNIKLNIHYSVLEVKLKVYWGVIINTCISTPIVNISAVGYIT